MQSKPLIIFLLIIFLVACRIFLGLQINFSHEDYTQIYLIGLENALLDNWSYWGPDVVWSKTRLAGALQGLLVGLPISLTKSIYSPLIFSNLLSSLGPILLAFYAHFRFPKLNLALLISLLLLLPFYLYHGVVVLNTAYLLFSGALLFISVFELYLYRNEMLFNTPYWYFAAIGFALLFTYQLHLTWVMFIPFILVLLVLEYRINKKSCLFCTAALVGGMCLSGSLILPTLLDFYDVIYSNAEGNLTFKGTRFLEIFDVFIRFVSFSTFDVTYNHDIYKHASNQSILVFGLLRLLKILGIIQFIFLAFGTWKIRKDKNLIKALILFGLSILMMTILYMLSNKHLSLRTYILLYPIPLWISFQVYSQWFGKKWFTNTLRASLVLVFITYGGVVYYNFRGPYSFHSVKNKIEKAIETKNPSEFGNRRKTLMDGHH